MAKANTHAVVSISRTLSRAVTALEFSGHVTHIYNPLEYAREPHENYLSRFANTMGTTLLLGMNPGPWGMAQTGVPFGEIESVRDWMKIEGAVGKPPSEHPKRPILGFECSRKEVSGARLWGWARQRFGTPQQFFERFFVWNYCPLCFMVESGANFTPDKLPADERTPLFAACDQGLTELVKTLQPGRIVGIGKFAQTRAKRALGRDDVETILHPSPASPAANRGWAEQIEAQFRTMGVTV